MLDFWDPAASHILFTSKWYITLCETWESLPAAAMLVIKAAVMSVPRSKRKRHITGGTLSSCLLLLLLWGSLCHFADAGFLLKPLGVKQSSLLIKALWSKISRLPLLTVVRSAGCSALICCSAGFLVWCLYKHDLLRRSYTHKRSHDLEMFTSGTQCPTPCTLMSDCCKTERQRKWVKKLLYCQASLTGIEFSVEQ